MTDLVPVSERRIVPAPPHTDKSRAEIVHRLNGVRDGDYAVPVTVRVVGNVVHTDSLMPSTQRRSFVGTILAAPGEVRKEIRQRIQEVRESRELEERREQVASIVAIIPAYNEQKDCALTAKKLLVEI